MTSDAILGISQQGVLGYLKADAALPALMNAAGHADATVRRAAMSALVFTHAGGPGTSALFAGLRDSHWQVREEAAASIGKVKLAEATEALIAALDDETWQVRAKAAAALGRIRAVRAVRMLGEALSHPISNLRKEAVAALGDRPQSSRMTWIIRLLVVAYFCGNANKRSLPERSASADSFDGIIT